MYGDGTSRILLIFHGSRYESSKKAISEIVEDVRKRTNYPVEAVTLSEIKTSSTIESLSKKNERIVAVPVFLSHGVHTDVDIPKILKKFKNVVYADPLSPDPRISEIILDKVRESGLKDKKVEWSYKTCGIPDHLFLKSKAGLTREEIRSIIVSKARIKGNEKVLDVGTGSGSVSIEFALLGCNVTAVEKDEENLKIAKENIEKFGLNDKIELLSGRIEEMEIFHEFDVVFFGGTDNLERSLERVFDNLKGGGRIIIAAVRLETVVEAIEVLKRKGINLEVLNLCLNRGKNLGGKTALSPSYPVFLIYGDK